MDPEVYSFYDDGFREDDRLRVRARGVLERVRTRELRRGSSLAAGDCARCRRRDRRARGMAGGAGVWRASDRSGRRACRRRCRATRRRGRRGRRPLRAACGREPGRRVAARPAPALPLSGTPVRPTSATPTIARRVMQRADGLWRARVGDVEPPPPGAGASRLRPHTVPYVEPPPVLGGGSTFDVTSIERAVAVASRRLASTRSRASSSGVKYAVVKPTAPPRTRRWRAGGAGTARPPR